MEVMRTRGLAHDKETHTALLEAYSWAGDTHGLMNTVNTLRDAGATLDADLWVIIVHFARIELMDAAHAEYTEKGLARAQITKVLNFVRAQGIGITQRAYDALLELHMRTRNVRM
jgi:hypothetical protein